MKIILHGSLKDLYPGLIEVLAETAAEAIMALSQRLQSIPSIKNRIAIELPAFQSRDSLYEKTDCSELHIHPALAGAGGKAGGMQIVLGILLIAVAIMMPASVALMGVTLTSGSVMMAGAMMVLGGVLQLLTPTPEAKAGANEKSEYLGTPKNTVKIGTPIPFVFGRRKVYGHYLSFDLDAKDKVFVTNFPVAGDPGKSFLYDYNNG